MRIDLRWNIVSVAFFFSTNKVGWWEWALYPHHFQLSFLAVRLWASHSTSLGVEKIYLWKIRELEWMTSKIPSSSTGSQGQVLILTGANALEAFISLILQPSAHLSTGEWMRSTKPSELNQVKEDNGSCLLGTYLLVHETRDTQRTEPEDRARHLMTGCQKGYPGRGVSFPLLAQWGSNWVCGGMQQAKCFQ